MYARHAELKAGVVLLLALSALLLLLYLASGETLFGSWRHVHLRLEPGKLAPKADDPVKMNGVTVGRVDSVAFDLDFRSGERLTSKDRLRLGLEPGADGTAREIYVHLVARLDAKQVLPEGTYAEISESITGSVLLTLVPGLSERNLRDGDTLAKPIPCYQAAGLPDLAARIAELVRQVEKLVESGGGVLAEAKATIATLHTRLDAVDTKSISDDVREAAAGLRRTLGALETRIATISENVEAASGDVRAIARRGEGLVEGVDKDLDELLATLKSVATRLDQLLERSAPKVEVFLDTLTRAAASLDVLAKDFQGLGPEARALLKSLGADATEMVRTLTDTAHNLLDTSEDVRSRPWVLLNKPEDEEIAFDNVRVATQNYARAMRDLNEAAARLGGLLKGPAPTDADTRRLVEEALARFRSSQERYQVVERALLEALRRTGPPARAPR